MNRRAFLVGVAASACSGGVKPPPTKRPDEERPGDPIPAEIPSGPSPLAVHDDTLVQRAGHELRWWDLREMKQIDTMVFDDLAASAFLADGTLAAYVEAADGCTLHRLAQGQPARTYRIRTCSALSRFPPIVLPAAEAVYIFGDEELELFRFAGFDLERTGTAPFSRVRDRIRGHAVSLGDRVITDGARPAVVTIGAPALTLALGDRRVVHLAAASNRKLWYSHAGRWGASHLALATIDAPLTEFAAFDVAPARIVEIASYGATIALLFVTHEGTWSLAVLDEDGHERWRTALPDRARTFEPAHVALALNAHRVVVQAPDETLLAWAADTGAPVAK